MIYRSNLRCPDLSSYFAETTICKPRPWSFGHDVMSDKDYEPDNGFMTHDEASILWHCARRLGGNWCDIGARFGWTTAHIADGSPTHAHVAIDREFMAVSGAIRFAGNVIPMKRNVEARALDSRAVWTLDRQFFGWCIDGNHSHPFPLLDAIQALQYSPETCCIVFHDFYGKPIRDGVRYLMEQGLKCRVYWTPNGMAVCWRGDFTPPVHEADPVILSAKYETRRDQMPDFPWDDVA